MELSMASTHWTLGSGALSVSRRIKVALALLAAMMMMGTIAQAAKAGTDDFCPSGCSFRPYYIATSQYDHHYTLVYMHDSLNTYKVGAGVWNCYMIAQAYGSVTHTYSTPCLSYAAFGNEDYPNLTGTAHGNF
jgi:hypothetical protein